MTRSGGYVSVWTDWKEPTKLDPAWPGWAGRGWVRRDRARQGWWATGSHRGSRPRRPRMADLG
jgi:hypothetical protein